MQTIRPAAALGFILNLPSGSKIAGWLPPSIFARKHWIAIRKIGDDLYFNLDSHLSEPEVIGAVSFLLSIQFRKECHSNQQYLIGNWLIGLPSHGAGARRSGTTYNCWQQHCQHWFVHKSSLINCDNKWCNLSKETSIYFWVLKKLQPFFRNA